MPLGKALVSNHLSGIVPTAAGTSGMPEPKSTGLSFTRTSSISEAARSVPASSEPPQSQMSFPPSRFSRETSPTASSDTSRTASSGLAAMLREKRYCSICG